MFQRICVLIYKEFLAVWRDPKSRFVLIIPPILQLIIFANAATLDVKNVPIAILNRDVGAQSYELIERFLGSPIFTEVFFIHSVGEIRQVIDRQEAMLAVHIDEQFSRRLQQKQPTEVQVILDGRKSNTAQIVLGYVVNILDNYGRDVAGEVNAVPSNVELVTRNWYNPNLIYYWFNVPNLSGILTTVVCLTLSSLSVARERELGTFDQLLVSPLRPFEILVGKMVPAAIFGLIEGTLIVLVAILVFQIPFTGSLILLYWTLIVFIASIVGVGLFISSLCATQQQTILGSFMFMTPAVLISGYATPLENMPMWLQHVSLFNPLRYYLVAIKGLFFKEMPLHIIFDQIWPMVIIACFTLSSAAWLFRRRLE